MASTKYPRVAWMEYFIRFSTGYEFVDGLKAKGSLGEFRYVLTWHLAEFFPEKDFVTVEDARAELEPLLQAWKVSGFLNVGPAAFSFEYCDSSVENSAADRVATSEKQKRRRPMPPSNLTFVYDQYPPLPEGLADVPPVLSSAQLWSLILGELGPIFEQLITRVSMPWGRFSDLCWRTRSGSDDRAIRVAGCDCNPPASCSVSLAHARATQIRSRSDTRRAIAH
jgi:hypothetical protein